MMAAFRAFAKSPLAIALLGVLIISFGVWGVSDAFKARISTWVVKAGSREVDRVAFKRTFDSQLRSFAQQSGQSISTQEAVQKHYDRELLQGLVQRETMLEELRRMGVEPSAKLVIDELRKIPAFFNAVTGRFDQAGYVDRLRREGLTPEVFENDLRDQIANAHFSVGLSAGLRAPLTYTSVYAVMNEQARSADAFQIDPRSVGEPPKPTDAQLNAILRTMRPRPEARVISLVRFSAQALAPTLKPDPAAVQKRFDFEKGRLSSAERRSFVQLTLKDAAQATAAAQRLAKGEAPAAVAKAFNTEPINYDKVPKATVADPRVADVAFSLQPGQASGPIRGEFGLAVVKLISIAPAKPATLEDVRSQIEAEVRAEQAENQVYDQVQKYDEVHDTGAPMIQAANAAKVQVYTLPPITADGKLLTGQPEQGLNAKMVADAFSLAQGAETEVVDLGKGEYYAIRVEKVFPSALPPLNEVRPALTNLYMQQQMFQRMQAKAESFVQRIKKGEAFEAVAQSAGSPVQHIQGVTRATASQFAGLGPEFLGEMFQAKAGDVFAARGQNYVAVAKITQVQNGDPAKVARLAVSLQPQMSAQIARADIIEAVLSAANAELKPKINETRAREAIGVSAEETAPAKGTGKAP
jgi:peptidyl-prolyl cis-trans isomerase D